MGTKVFVCQMVPFARYFLILLKGFLLAFLTIYLSSVNTKNNAGRDKSRVPAFIRPHWEV